MSGGALLQRRLGFKEGYNFQQILDQVRLSSPHEYQAEPSSPLNEIRGTIGFKWLQQTSEDAFKTLVEMINPQTLEMALNARKSELALCCMSSYAFSKNFWI